MKIRGITVGTPTKPEKNLVRATGLSAEEQAQARANIGTAGVFIAEYGVTTHVELEEAYNAGKMLYCKDGAYYSCLYQRTSSGSFCFYGNDSASLKNRYCTKSSGWKAKTLILCDASLAALADEIEKLKKELADIKKYGVGGNGNIITFYVGGEAYTAEQGMTWANFVNSRYNPQVHFDCCESEGPQFGIVGSYEYDEYSDYVFVSACCGPPSYVDTGEIPAFSYDEIMDGHHYVTWQ